MCGFVGCFNPSGLPEDVVNHSMFRNMIWALDKRGPDEKAMLIGEQAWLGHTRLSIVDIDSGQQPMGWEEDLVHIVFNGEIFNFVELREELLSDGVKFKTRSDTEVLLRMYLHFGVDMLPKLNGQFAFCIWDKRSNKVFLARDQFGILPLYYTFVGGSVFFSSSVRALIQHPGVSKNLDLHSLKSLTQLWVAPEDRSFIEGIKSLRSGEMATFDSGGLEIKRYWNLSFSQDNYDLSEDEVAGLVREKLSRSVSLRLQADVPVGSYLSGGLDSSIICGLVNQNFEGRYNAFSVQFADEDYDESQYQNALINSLNVNHHSVVVSPEDISANYRNAVMNAEQPIFRTAPTPLMMLSNTVNAIGRKVVLTGEGADEISWGYNIFKEALIRQKINSGCDEQKWRDDISSLYPYLQHFNSRFSALIMDFYKKNSLDITDPLFTHLTRYMAGDQIQSYFSDDIQSVISDCDTLQNLYQSLPAEYESFSLLQKCQTLEMKTLLPGYLLSSQGDRMSMANSVEARYPFLDIDVVKFFSSIPDEMKLKGRNEKYILKKAFADELPDVIINRPKQPYRAPESISLLSGELIDRYLTEDLVKSAGIFKWELVSRLIDKLRHANSLRHFSFNDNLSFNIVLSTQIFIEDFLGSSGVVVAPENAEIKEIFARD